MTSCFERIHFWNHKTHFHAMKRFQRTKFHTHLTATLGRYPSSRRRLIHWRKSATIDTYRSLLSPTLYSLSSPTRLRWLRETSRTLHHLLHHPNQPPTGRSREKRRIHPRTLDCVRTGDGDNTTEKSFRTPNRDRE